MNRRQKMKKMKQEIEMLRSLTITPKIEPRIDGLQHMRCSTGFREDDTWIPPEIKERMVVERIAAEMTDIIKKKVVKKVALYECVLETYTFDFWVKEG